METNALINRIETSERTLASGNVAILDQFGVAMYILSYEEAMYASGWEGPTCSICDAVGHGYPGGGPCPLEERGEQGVPAWAQ